MGGAFKFAFGHNSYCVPSGGSRKFAAGLVWSPLAVVQRRMAKHLHHRRFVRAGRSRVEAKQRVHDRSACRRISAHSRSQSWRVHATNQPRVRPDRGFVPNVLTTTRRLSQVTKCRHTCPACAWAHCVRRWLRAVGFRSSTFGGRPVRQPRGRTTVSVALLNRAATRVHAEWASSAPRSRRQLRGTTPRHEYAERDPLAADGWHIPLLLRFP